MFMLVINCCFVTNRELVMDSNEIRIAAGREIVAAVAGKDGLERLSVDGNWFGEDGEKTLTKLLKEAGKFEVWKI